MTRRVFIVDDEPNIVISLKFILERSGFDVEVREDGRSAMALLKDDLPDVLILDVMLPDTDGFEILKQLRDQDRTRELPILMLTAKGQREDRNNAVNLGANMFISKPFANEDVINAVKSLADR